MAEKKLRTRPEKQQRFFKARIIKFNRKLTRLGEKAVGAKHFSNLMIEGRTLLLFSYLSSRANSESKIDNQQSKITNRQS